MADWLGNDIASFVGGLALVSAVGIIPRVGFMRALTLGYSSYFKTSYPLSVRKPEIKKLNDLVLQMERGSYIIVTGGNGNGKSCLINTTFNRQHGVVKISVSYLSYSIFV